MSKEEFKQRKIWTRASQRSNIIFDDFTIPAVKAISTSQNIANQNQNQSSVKNIGQISVIGQLMSEKPQKVLSTELKRYQNKIIPTERNYSVAKFGYDQPIKQKFVDVLTKRKKFWKPYSECTKYVDSLMRSKGLIRRGPNQIPLETMEPKRMVSSNIPQHTNTQGNLKTIFKRTRNQKLYKPSSQKQKTQSTNKFDNTIQGHIYNYQSLKKRQTSLKQQKIDMKNSMNRILAAQMITYSLLQKTGRGYSLKQRF